MKLKHLEMILETIEPIADPRTELEQYGTPPPLAARLLYHARINGDIEGKRVLDLGCGTGILACGAALLSANAVVGVDIDPRAIEAARRNAGRLGVEVEFHVSDVAALDRARCGRFDTVVMNPPFGAQRRHADRPFIDRALALGKAVYGIFNAGSRRFIADYVRGRAEIAEIIGSSLPMKRTFLHHRRERIEIPVEIIVMRRIDDEP
ncbi:MAG: METTL5 family protein [Methanomicrobiales archaeon]|nr:METTL5 family protein [Methanomicrobiales archaeon]MDI6875377.1 METTL5 family protein [Methanomicrobiales archaeon]